MTNHSAFRRLIDQFPKSKILVIGDLMIDRFIRGKVSRISPEAPVPVVQVKSEIDMPGGAGNVMMNLAALESHVTGCGLVGGDNTGEKLQQQFRKLGIQTDGIREDLSRTTTLKTRVIAEHQQVVRFDHENEKTLNPAQQNEFQKWIRLTIPKIDGVILSDYGKGMITKPILTETIATARKFKKPVCVDPKLEHFLSYKNVTCVTPNLSEAVGGMRRIRVSGENGIRDLGHDILKTLRCRSVLITQGEEGMTLFERNRITHIQAKAKEVFDVTGAGDTVIAVFALCVACGSTLAQAAILANLAAGIVIGKLGTATVTTSELKESLKRL